MTVRVLALVVAGSVVAYYASCVVFLLALSWIAPHDDDNHYC